jgi:curved DNA-binding protein CbpA
MARNPYQVLGVPDDASAEEIHRAYRRLARRHHPDLNADADADTRFREILGAFEVLSDPAQRALHDRSTAAVRRATSARPTVARVPYFSDPPVRDVPRFTDRAARVSVSVRVSWLPRFLERWR